MKDVAVIIVSWNKKELLKSCFDSLLNQTYKNFRIILVDNGSTDGSANFIRKSYPEAEIVELDKNTGFAYGNNIGIKKALEAKEIKYIITLNNDTRADSMYIENLLACVKKHPRTGSIQPKVINFFDTTKIDCAGLLISPDMGAIDRGSGREDKGQFEKEEEIFGASASAALYTREALEKTQISENEFFDSDYFAYYEDVDLAWRIRLAGFYSVYCPEAKILHVHGATAKKFSSFQKFYIHRNHFYNIIKDLPLGFAMKSLTLMLGRYFILAKSILQKKGSSANLVKNEGGQSIIKVVPRVWWQVINNLPSLLRKRAAIQKNVSVKNQEIKTWFKKFGINIKQGVYGN